MTGVLVEQGLGGKKRGRASAMTCAVNLLAGTSRASGVGAQYVVTIRKVRWL